ncbi:MAG: hypothetical protein C4295_10340 [Candidatus Fervidibacterota bacterium]
MMRGKNRKNWGLFSRWTLQVVLLIINANVLICIGCGGRTSQPSIGGQLELRQYAENQPLNPTEEDPYEEKKLILSYLLLTPDYEQDKQELYRMLSLSDQEILSLQEIAEKENEAFMNLKSTYWYGREEPEFDNEEFDMAVDKIHQQTDEAIRHLLGDRYPMFREFIRQWWPRHVQWIEQFKTQVISSLQVPRADNIRPYSICDSILSQPRRFARGSTPR